MVLMSKVTLPGHCWINLNGTKASLKDLGFTTLTSKTRTNHGTQRRLLTTIKRLSVQMDSQIKERWCQLLIVIFFPFSLIYVQIPHWISGNTLHEYSTEVTLWFCKLGICLTQRYSDTESGNSLNYYFQSIPQTLPGVTDAVKNSQSKVV